MSEAPGFHRVVLGSSAKKNGDSIADHHHDEAEDLVQRTLTNGLPVCQH
jgi:hypothetical protein